MLAVEARPVAVHDDAPPQARSSGAELARSAWLATWPKLVAVAIFLGCWQLVVALGYKPRIIRGPGEVVSELWRMTSDGTIPSAIRITFQRAVVGFAVSVVVGMAIGLAVASSKVVRSAIGSMITGIQTMPSIAWFPLAIGMFQLSEEAIRFVVVLGAAPSIANGLISGVDHVPALLRRAGRMLGASGLKNYRHVVLPATLPSLVGGLKQGWAFAWRSLMAGELLVVIRGEPSVGFLLAQFRELSKYDSMIAMMIVIFLVGLIVDAAVFGTLDRAIRRRWGLLGE